MARKLIQVDAVILDELGYLPFPKSGGALLFLIFNSCLLLIAPWVTDPSVASKR
jgi:DNA replication protein DnaC